MQKIGCDKMDAHSCAMRILRAATDRQCAIWETSRHYCLHLDTLGFLPHHWRISRVDGEYMEIDRETARIILRGLLDRRTTEYLKMRDTDVEILEGHRDALIKENLELLEEIDTLKREREELVEEIKETIAFEESDRGDPYARGRLDTLGEVLAKIEREGE